MMPGRPYKRAAAGAMPYRADSKTPDQVASPELTAPHGSALGQWPQHLDRARTQPVLTWRL